MVLYFTGTGNSLYVAKSLEEDCRSIPQAVKNQEYEFTDERIGIVSPVYGHEMPALVQKFIKKAVFHTDYLYLVETYGHRHGGANELATKLFEENGKHLSYTTTISLADNFLPNFDMIEEVEFDKYRNIEENIKQIKADIEEKKLWHQPVTEEDRQIHKEYIARMSQVPASFWGNLYSVSDGCIGCGICTRVCPVGCIKLENKKAVHQLMDGEGNVVCNACMACIHHCPQNAISLNMPEKNPNARYRNSHVKISEIVSANNQN